MPFSSPFPSLDIRKCNLLDYLFPRKNAPSDTPIWIDSKDTDQHLTSRSLLQWSKRLALGLDHIGSKPGEVVMIFTPNHVYVPVAYLGIVGSKRIFSGANPAYTVSGNCFASIVQDRTLTTLRDDTPGFKHRGAIHSCTPKSDQSGSSSGERCRPTRRSCFPILRRAMRAC